MRMLLIKKAINNCNILKLNYFNILYIITNENN